LDFSGNRINVSEARLVQKKKEKARLVGGFAPPSVRVEMLAPSFGVRLIS
jgi:hypothetical protein